MSRTCFLIAVAACSHRQKLVRWYIDISMRGYQEVQEVQEVQETSADDGSALPDGEARQQSAALDATLCRHNVAGPAERSTCMPRREVVCPT